MASEADGGHTLRPEGIVRDLRPFARAAGMRVSKEPPRGRHTACDTDGERNRESHREWRAREGFNWGS